MAKAPAAAPHRKTKANATVAAIRGSQPPWSRGRSSRLVLIGGQTHQHVVRGRSRIECRQLLLRHNRFWRRTAWVGGFARNQIRPQNRQGKQRSKHQAATESEIQTQQASDRWRQLLFRDAFEDSRVEAGGWAQFFPGLQGTEPSRDFLHALSLVAAHLTGLQMGLDLSLSRRLQRAGEVLFQASHHYRMHRFLPLQMFPILHPIPPPRIFWPSAAARLGGTAVGFSRPP